MSGMIRHWYDATGYKPPTADRRWSALTLGARSVSRVLPPTSGWRRIDDLANLSSDWSTARLYGTIARRRECPEGKPSRPNRGVDNGRSAYACVDVVRDGSRDVANHA